MTPGKYIVDENGDHTPVCEYGSICPVHGTTVDSISANAKRIDLNQRDISKLHTKAGAMDAKVSELRKDVDILTQDQKKLHERVGGMETSIVKTTTELDHLVDKIGTAAASMGSLTKTMDSVTADMNRRFTSVNENLHKINTQVVILSLKVAAIFTGASGVGWILGKFVFKWW